MPELQPPGSPDSANLPMVAAPSDAFVQQLALSLRDQLRLRLFNFDLIRVNDRAWQILTATVTRIQNLRFLRYMASYDVARRC
jgi:hypothetical protein